jgi:hypothetical protein
MNHYLRKHARIFIFFISWVKMGSQAGLDHTSGVISAIGLNQ